MVTEPLILWHKEQKGFCLKSNSESMHGKVNLAPRSTCCLHFVSLSFTAYILQVSLNTVRLLDYRYYFKYRIFKLTNLRDSKLQAYSLNELLYLSCCVSVCSKVSATVLNSDGGTTTTVMLPFYHTCNT